MTRPEEQKQVAIIGSGFGGLALGVRLQARGYPVTIFEKRERVGGRAYQLLDRGFTFDMGPSLITAPRIIESIFEAAGKRVADYVELMPLDPFYRIHFHDGSSIDYTGDPGEMRARMAAFSPRDASRYDDFMSAVRPIYDAVIEDGLGARPFDSLRSLLSFAPRALKLSALKPVADFAASFFEDERHRFLFSFHPLFLGGNPFRAPSIYTMIPYLEREQGVWFARGGMYALVEALERVFMELGGRIETGAEVSEIVIRGGRAVGVRVHDAVHEAPIIVSNADVGHTYADLVASPRQRARWSKRRVAALEYSMSCFILYLGVERTYPQLAHHTLILSERYRELVEDVFERKVLPDDFSMYLHAPTRTDPGMAPPGCESLYVLVPVPNLLSSHRWDRANVEAYTEKILTHLENWGLEDLRKQTRVMHAFTPSDFLMEFNAYVGNAFGPEPRLTQTAYFRPHNRSEDVAGLYLVGAGTHPGAGVPGVMLSAEATEYCILSDEKGDRHGS